MQQWPQVRIAAAVTRTTEDVDGDLASGTTDAKVVTTMAGADKGLQ